MSLACDYGSVNGNSFSGTANDDIALLNLIYGDLFFTVGGFYNSVLGRNLNKALNSLLGFVLADRVNVSAELDRKSVV